MVVIAMDAISLIVYDNINLLAMSNIFLEVLLITPQDLHLFLVIKDNKNE